MTDTLPDASASTTSASDAARLEPFETSFPSSQKVHDRVEWNGHELLVPKRRIHLSNGEAPVDVYDTSGPQGCDVRVGVPKPRTEWIAKRRASNETGNFSQMHYARRGVVTEEMAFVAAREGVDPETVVVTGNTVIDALFRQLELQRSRNRTSALLEALTADLGFSPEA